MNEFILTEFSIFYKRLVKVEICLKKLIVEKYTNFYGENAYNIFNRYLKTLNTRNTERKIFTKIYNSSKTSSDKLELSINEMYISEILNLFTNKVFLKNKVRHDFFREKVQTNDNNFLRKAKALKDFRNCLAHCNEKKYKIEKTKFIDGLIYFEKILNCSVSMDYDLLTKIPKFKKLSTTEILNIIYTYKKDYFKDDKLLIMLFDDIALMNGYTFQGLPQRWTIVRQKYELERKVNGSSENNIKDDKSSQMHLPF